MSEKRIFPLSKLTEAIENVISRYCNKVVWVKAEIVKLNYYKHSGHCYPDLVEKKEGKIIAEIRGNIWKPQFDQINSKFRSVLNEDLRDDMTVVIQATVTYSSVYGLALNILDIDPEYTLGELAKQKAETIKRLKEEEIFDANKLTTLPRLPKTIAIVSVSSSKGYQDFLNVIENNPWGYEYHHLLFPAILQGERAVGTIIAQLEKIKLHAEIFDAVAIIRGGGGEIGLRCYDSYILAKAIAEFPIPVLTGIGHSTNETVSELVSFKSFITPTKIAEFLIQEFHNFSYPLQENIQKLNSRTSLLFERQNRQIIETSRLFGSLTQRVLDRSNNRLNQLQNALMTGSSSLLQHERTELKHKTNNIELLSPQNILKRGFSVTRRNGKVISSADEVQPGEYIETQLYNGRISSRIEEKNLNEN